MTGLWRELPSSSAAQHRWVHRGPNRLLSAKPRSDPRQFGETVGNRVRPCRHRRRAIPPGGEDARHPGAMAAATSLGWSPTITAPGAVAARPLDGGQQMRRIGLAGGKLSPPPIAAKNPPSPSASSSARAGRSGLLVQTASRQPSARIGAQRSVSTSGYRRAPPRSGRHNRQRIRQYRRAPASGPSRRRRAGPAAPPHRPPFRRPPAPRTAPARGPPSAG